jgi:hypothetical protein
VYGSHPHPQQYPPQYVPQYVPQPATIKGVPLQPGERVIFVRNDDGSDARIGNIIVGVLLLVIAIGIIFLVMAFLDHSYTFAITTQRFLLIKGNDPSKAKWIPLGQVRRVTRIMRRGRLDKVRLEGANNQEMLLEVMIDDRDQLGRMVLATVENPALPQQLPPAPNVVP